MMIRAVSIVVMMAALMTGVWAPFAFAEIERDAAAAQAAALGNSPDMDEPELEATEAKQKPPAKTVYDLTKGGQPYKLFIGWQMGPTGIIGCRNDKRTPTQLRVSQVLPGSPAEGKVLPGDVVVGVQGRKFDVSDDMDRVAGDAIIAAETEAGGGDLTVNIWRDRNWSKRTSARKTASEEIKNVDADKLVETLDPEKAVLYAWENAEKRKAEVAAMVTPEDANIPIDGFYTNVALKLEVMGTYSETSPWDCPVVQKVRDNAVKRIADSVAKSSRWSWQSILALVASGKPEYVALARKKVHEVKLTQDMNQEFTLEDVESFAGRSKRSWGVSTWLDMAIYYDATGDAYVLPEIRRVAILTAMGQSGGGTWGHTFSLPKMNGGKLHRNDPGYGAMNNAGTRCFFMIAMAKRAGIEHPEIDAAIARASLFFRTYVDKGCIPYGCHSPYQSDDSNGKNYGAAYGFYALGNIYEAKYFGMHSAHASFTRRGGHGSPVFWYYTPLSGHLAGPKAVQAYMRNMRYFYTLSRRHDGSFIFLGNQYPGIGGQGMGLPTETVALHLSMPLQQLITTGKGAEKTGVWMTDEEYEELLQSAVHQVGDATLKKMIGPLAPTFETDRLIEMLDHFFPNRRREYAGNLGKRYANGEKDIVAKVVARLDSPEARMREGACMTLSACGSDVLQQHMDKFVKLLHNDPAEIVRIAAARAIAGATPSGDKRREVELLKAMGSDYPGMTMDHGNLHCAIRGILFTNPKRGTSTSKLMTTPFQAGYDEDLVRRALEQLVTMDPQGDVPNSWDKETLLKLAGPVTFAASELQVSDSMFGGARKGAGQNLLRKHGYRDVIEASCFNLIQRGELPREIRRGARFKGGMFPGASILKTPGLYRDRLDDFRLMQLDNPLNLISDGQIGGVNVPINQVIAGIELDTDVPELPEIGPDVKRMFQAELLAAGDEAAQLARCRMEIAEPDRKNYFRKMYAMTHLADTIGAKAIDDVSTLLGHENYRVREHAEQVAVELIAKGAGPRLVERFQEVQTQPFKYGGNWNAAGILNALTRAAKENPAAAKPWAESALATVTGALKHKDPRIREAAVPAVYMIGGDAALNTVFSFMQVAKTHEDFNGIEQALLIMRDDPDHVERISQAAIKLLPGASVPARRSLAWVLAQFGGEANLAAIAQAAEGAVDDGDLQEMIMALAYSPDRAASDTMVALAKRTERIRKALGIFNIQRMVGRNGVGDVTDAERVRFARGILNMMYDDNLAKYLQFVYTADSLQLLCDVMKTNPKQSSQSLIVLAEAMKNPTPEEKKRISEILVQVMEYIEVNHLRGGFGDRAGGAGLPENYTEWKNWQTRASKLLLEYNQPEAEPIPQFEDMNLIL